MGRATKWLRRLFGSKREAGERKVPFHGGRTEKKRWSFKLGRDSADAAGKIPPANPSPAEVARLRSPCEENEQNKHAIAVAAAATAAAAAAAVQAAVAVARLTSNRGGIIFCSIHELVAAIKIQAFFRGFLARRALRALRALVKLQALIRGYLIRKKAATTLHCMEALIRAQETVRAQKSKSLIIHKSSERSGETKTLKKTSSFHISSLDWSPKFLQISPLPSPLQGSSSTPEWSLPLNRSRRSFTAQSTPRFMNSGGGGGGGGGFPPPSPVINYPNYMSKTRAFEAKDRSQSAPKQRLGKRVPFGELMAEEEQSRASLSRHGIQRSCSQASESFNFRNAVVGRLELNRGTEKDFYFKGK